MFSFLPGGNQRFWVAAVHAAFWIAYTGITFFANYIADPKVTITGAIFYMSLFWIGRYKKMGTMLSVITFITTLLFLAIITYMYIYKALPAAKLQLYTTNEVRHFIKYTILGYIQFYAYALLYYVGNGLFNSERQLRITREQNFIKEIENARLKEQELKAQYAFLRAQVNPHFLYNSLNTIFSKAQEYSDDLAENISKLARMMRYSFETIENENDAVSVEKELQNLQLLLDINHIRFEGEKLVGYSVEGIVTDQVIPPLSLITIVENAFKYGDLSDPRHPLTIKVRLTQGQLYFYCGNRKSSRQLNVSSTNIGIANLKKRMDISLPGKYDIRTTDEQGFFTFELTINN